MTKTCAGGGGGGDANEYVRSLLYFSGSDLSLHLCHVNAERMEAMEGLNAFLYDRFNDGVSRMDLTRIFIALGGDTRVGGGGVGVRVGGGRRCERCKRRRQRSGRRWRLEEEGLHSIRPPLRRGRGAVEVLPLRPRECHEW